MSGRERRAHPMLRALRTPSASLPEDDIGRYVGFFGPYAWMLCGLWMIVAVWTALAHGGDLARSPLGFVALAAVLLALVLIVTPSPTPLPRRRTLAVLAVIVFLLVAITWQQPIDGISPCACSWEVSSADLLLLCLALRGRILAAWIGYAVMGGLIVLWSAFVADDLQYGLYFVYLHMFSLVACSVFAVGLHRTARRIVAHRAAERERVGRDVRDSMLDRQLAAELRVVRDLSEPVLTSIAADEPVDASVVRSLEAALRDRIRGRTLAVEPLVSALRSARERGADIVLLDDLVGVELSDEKRARAASWAAREVLSAADSGEESMTLRIAADGHGPHVTFSAAGASCTELRIHGRRSP